MSLHRELVLDHARRPRGEGLRTPFDGASHRRTPRCGDEVELRVRVGAAAGAEVVLDVSHDVVGCALSRASTSMLHELVVGRAVADVAGLHRAVAAVAGGGAADGTDLGDAEALAGVAGNPLRLACALLPWAALEEALAAALAARSRGPAV